MDPSSVLGQSSGVAPPTSSVVSRPDFLPQVPAPVLAQPQPPAQMSKRENNLVANIDNFADFDGAAFDSLPPGNLQLFLLIKNISIIFQIKLNLNP